MQEIGAIVALTDSLAAINETSSIMIELKIAEERYRQILDQHQKGELIIFIDTASFREFFTENKVRKTKELIGLSIKKESAIIRLIFYSLPFFLVGMAFFIIRGFQLYALLTFPAFLLVWLIIHSKASTGIQRINGAIIFLLISIFLSFSFLNQLPLDVKLSVISFAFLIFLSKLLYFLSSKFAFQLLFKHYIFFAFFYETKLKATSLTAMLWTDSKDNYENFLSMKRKHGI